MRIRDDRVTSHQHRRFVDPLALTNYPTVIEFGIILSGPQRCPGGDRTRIGHVTVNLCHIVHFLDARIGPKRQRLKHSPRHRIAINNETVVLIVSRLGRRSNNTVRPVGHLPLCDCFIRKRATEGCFSITELVLICAESALGDRGHVSDSLLGLRVGELVARRLVVIGERNHGCHETHYRARVDFDVSVFGGQIVASPPGDVGLVGLDGVTVLDEPRARAECGIVRGGNRAWRSAVKGGIRKWVDKRREPHRGRFRQRTRSKHECIPGVSVQVARVGLVAERLKCVGVGVGVGCMGKTGTVPQWAHRATFIQQNPHRPVGRVERNGRSRGHARVPLEQAQCRHEFARHIRESNRARVNLNNGQCGPVIRCGVGHRRQKPATPHPIVHGFHGSANGKQSHERNVLGRADVCARGGFRRTEVARV